VPPYRSRRRRAHVGMMATGQNELREALRFARLTSSITKRREESLELRGLSNMIMQLRKLCNHPFVFEEVESAVNPTKINNAEGMSSCLLR
jgi:SNF2 family DNA or RNA helicase